MEREYSNSQDLGEQFLSLELPAAYWAQNRRIFAETTDEWLYLPTHGELQQFLKEHPIRDEFHGEGFDCDDFSFILKGRASEYGRRVLELKHSMCLGIAWGNFNLSGGVEYHACNWVVEKEEGEDNLTFYWVEPQTGEWKEKDYCAGGLTLMIV